MVWIYLRIPPGLRFLLWSIKSVNLPVIPAAVGKHHRENLKILSGTQKISVPELEATQLHPHRTQCFFTLQLIPVHYHLAKGLAHTSASQLHFQLVVKSIIQITFHLHIPSEERSIVGTLLLTLYFQYKFEVTSLSLVQPTH